MKKSKLIFGVLLIAVLAACGSKQETKEDTSERKIGTNISILLDLSDRINVDKYPNEVMQYWERDAKCIEAIAKVFKQEILDAKAESQLNEEIRIFTEPEAKGSDVNQLMAELKFKFNRETPDMDAEISSMVENYNSHPEKIYSKTIKTGDYPGSDIFSFFKNSVKEKCIAEQKRNILIIFTDGYLYHKDSKMDDGSRSSYFVEKPDWHKTLDKADNWKELISEKDYGFIKATDGLEDLEVMIVGINPYDGHNKDFDILKQLWTKWLIEMGVKESNIDFVKSELPTEFEDRMNKKLKITG